MRRHPSRTFSPRSVLNPLPRLTRPLIAIILLLATLGALWSAHAEGSAGAAVVVRANLPSAQPVGATITWTAAAPAIKGAVYQFSVASAGSPFTVVRGFERASSFAWTPMQEGTYRLQATVKAGFAAGKSSDGTASFIVRSRITGKAAVVSGTANPLVALYSVPPCTAGKVVIQFRPADGSDPWQSTAARPCEAGQSINVLVAGMRASTKYMLRHVVSAGKGAVTSAPLTFTTGTPPKGLQIATFQLRMPAGRQSDTKSPVIFHFLNPQPAPFLANPLATDLRGRLVWYFDPRHTGLSEIWPTRLLAGDTFLTFARDRYRTTGTDVVLEVDLAGNLVRETSLDAVNAQLAARKQGPIYSFHHDALRLPNGYTAVLGAAQRKVNGHDVMGDMVIVLDTNLQVTWAWSAFDHLSVPTTFPAGTPTCANDGATLCGLPDPLSLDWTHANDIGWSSEDGDLTVSLRNLSLLVKIDYRNGQGNGEVVWQLSNGGSFSLKSASPDSWFSHQHNAYLLDPTTVILFDNSNQRCDIAKIVGCDSRGQVYKIDEQHHTATLQLNVNLESFWQALGSAQKLANGDYFFAGGYAPPSRAIEFRPDGTKVFELDTGLAEYRAYRVGVLSS
jgi:arylsulfate sulfotransferase